MKPTTTLKILFVLAIASITFLALALHAQLARGSWEDNSIKVSGQYLQDANSQNIQNASQLVTETYNPQKTVDGDYLQNTARIGDKLMVR